MPQVGGKHFPYTEAGYKAAAAAKKRRGHTDYRKGGLFFKSGGLKPPTSKQTVRKAKYKKQTKKLLKAMET